MKPLQYKLSRNRKFLVAGMLSSVALAGCQPPGNPLTDPPMDVPPVEPRGHSLSLDPRIGTTTSAPQALVPIMGGTLLATRDNSTAIVSDPDRDRVVIVDLISGRVLSQIALPAGDSGTHR